MTHTRLMVSQDIFPIFLSIIINGINFLKESNSIPLYFKTIEVWQEIDPG